MVARDFLELTKPRIVVLVLVTVAAGFALGASGPFSVVALLHTLVGTALAAGGTNALNQVWEADVDARMRRTRGRPIPAGRLSPRHAARFAWLSGAAGVAYLWIAVNPLAASLAGATLLSYVFLYTPLKRRTGLATLVGAVPGALPVLGGWAAARGALGAEAWVLFGMMYLWQLPHVLALSWIHREDYAAAGLRQLSGTDAGGRITFAYATLAATTLLALALAPRALGMAGNAYAAGAAALSGVLLWASVSAAREPSPVRARRLFTVSLGYWPAVMTLLLADKLL